MARSASIRASNAASRVSSRAVMSGLKLEWSARSTNGGPLHRARASSRRRRASCGSLSTSSLPRVARASKRKRSTNSGSTRKTYPSPCRSISSSINLRRFEMYVCTELLARSGGFSPQSVSIKVSTDTGSPGFAARSARTLLCFWPPSETGSPASRTSNGPSTRNSMIRE